MNQNIIKALSYRFEEVDTLEERCMILSAKLKHKKIVMLVEEKDEQYELALMMQGRFNGSSPMQTEFWESLAIKKEKNETVTSILEGKNTDTMTVDQVLENMIRMYIILNLTTHSKLPDFDVMFKLKKQK